jgi:hypothetical protein
MMGDMRRRFGIFFGVLAGQSLIAFNLKHGTWIK